MFKLNKTVQYKPNRGQWIQKLHTDDIVKPNVVVTKDGISFHTNYTNVFQKNIITNAPTELVTHWQDRLKTLDFYVHCLNFAVFCATSGIGIAVEHFHTESPLINSIIRFHFYYNVRKILYHLKIKLPTESGFSKYKTDYDKDAYLSICNAYGIDQEPHGRPSGHFDWRYQHVFSSNQNGEIQYLYKSKPEDADSWSRWVMPVSKGLTRQGVQMLSDSIRVYTYCLLAAQSGVRASIIGSNANNFEAQTQFVNNLEDFIKKKSLLHGDIARYESILSNARSPVDFSLGSGLYMLPSDLRLKQPNDVQNFNDKIKTTTTTEHEPHGRPSGQNKTTTEHKNKTMKLPLNKQKLSLEHREEMTSIILFGSIITIGVIYYLKKR